MAAVSELARVCPVKPSRIEVLNAPGTFSVEIRQNKGLEASRVALFALKVSRVPASVIAIRRCKAIWRGLALWRRGWSKRGINLTTG
ncbi:MAG: hypothetical protein IPI44_14510 [Sulfuritalea sp.]|nr:hypothetical protein [Sulfuritalea sp.]